MVAAGEEPVACADRKSVVEGKGGDGSEGEGKGMEVRNRKRMATGIAVATMGLSLAAYADEGMWVSQQLQ